MVSVNARKPELSDWHLEQPKLSDHHLSGFVPNLCLLYSLSLHFILTEGTIRWPIMAIIIMIIELTTPPRSCRIALIRWQTIFIGREYEILKWTTIEWEDQFFLGLTSLYSFAPLR